jgi:hypothetical protein
MEAGQPDCTENISACIRCRVALSGPLQPDIGMQSDRRESAASQTLPLNCCLFHQDIFPTVTLVGRSPEVLIRDRVVVNPARYPETGGTSVDPQDFDCTV